MSHKLRSLRRFAPVLAGVLFVLPLALPVRAASADSAAETNASEQAQALTPEGYFTRIEELLTEAKTAYQAGDRDAATEALIEAYLENFEYLEAPLGAVDHDRMEALELTLRENLRALVAQGVPAEAFTVAVDDALAHLDEAEALLP